MKRPVKKKRRPRARKHRGGDASITCPYCFQHYRIAIDPGGGQDQSFVYDCEVCCHPAVITVSIEPDGTITAHAEREG